MLFEKKASSSVKVNMIFCGTGSRYFLEGNEYTILSKFIAASIFAILLIFPNLVGNFKKNLTIQTTVYG